jgi:hypothetical protein
MGERLFFFLIDNFPSVKAFFYMFLCMFTYKKINKHSIINQIQIIIIHVQKKKKNEINDKQCNQPTRLEKTK